MSWADNVDNKTFNLVYQLIFNFVLAVHVQKIGVRCNDSSMIAAGRYKFMPLFFAFNHPIYQEIEYRDLRNQVLYPKEVKHLLDNSMSFTESQLDQNHQGGDFCLEGKIKRLKMAAPKGAISKGVWKQLSRGIESIEKICEQANSNLNLGNNEVYRENDLYDEIVKWRSVLRESEMISDHEDNGFVHNIYKERLSVDMENFTENVVEKMHLFWDLVGEGKEIKRNMYNYLTVTQDIENEFSDQETDYDTDN